MEQAKEILHQVCDFMDADKLFYQVRDDAPVIRTGFRGDAAAFDIMIMASAIPPVLGIYVNIPVVVPEPRRAAMAETVARANLGLCLGCFDLDMSTGQLAFRTTMPIPEATITHGQFRHLLGSATVVVDGYFPAFVRLLYGDDLSPAEVIAEVEMQDPEPAREPRDT